MSDQNTTVEYRSIEGFPAYRVGDDGSVWSCWKKIGGRQVGKDSWRLSDEWKRLTVSSCAKGKYATVVLTRDKHSNPRAVHRLVLEAFVGLRPAGLMCYHYDGDRRNNSLPNLRWGSRKENEADKKRHGTVQKGDCHYATKVSDQDVEIIRALKDVMSRRTIAEAFGISRSHVGGILVGRDRIIAPKSEVLT